MTGHLSATELEQYVLGMVAQEGAVALETHVGTCPACASLLQREAALERSLGQLARHVSPVRQARLGRRPERIWPRVAAVGLLASMAATAGSVGVWRQFHPRVPPSVPAAQVAPSVKKAAPRPPPAVVPAPPSEDEVDTRLRSEAGKRDYPSGQSVTPYEDTLPPQTGVGP